MVELGGVARFALVFDWGSRTVMSRWSVTGPPVVVDVKLLSETPPGVVVMTLTGEAAEPSTAVVVPPHVYVNAGLVPASVQATEQFRTYIWRPSVVLVSSTEDVVAVVVRLTLFMASVLVLTRSTARLMVSPGTTLVAPTLSRLAAPLAPRAISTFPAVTFWLADVVDVNVAKVPRPAMAPAAPRAASDKRIFLEVLLVGTIAFLSAAARCRSSHTLRDEPQAQRKARARVPQNL